MAQEINAVFLQRFDIDPVGVNALSSSVRDQRPVILKDNTKFGDIPEFGAKKLKVLVA